MPQEQVVLSNTADGSTAAKAIIPVSYTVAGSVTASATGIPIFVVPASPTNAQWVVEAIALAKGGTAGDRTHTVTFNKQPAGGGAAVALNTAFSLTAVAGYKNSVTGDASITGGGLAAVANRTLAAGDQITATTVAGGTTGTITDLTATLQLATYLNNEAGLP